MDLNELLPELPVEVPDAPEVTVPDVGQLLDNG